MMKENHHIKNNSTEVWYGSLRFLISCATVLTILFFSINISFADECSKKIDVDAALPYYIQGKACENIGNYKKAVEAYKQAINKIPEFGYAYYQLGLVYLAMGNKDAAKEQYNNLMEIDDPLTGELAGKLLFQIYGRKD